jgi:hypothetical protein
MILGSTDPTPYDLYALAVLVVLAGVLFVGCILGPRWISELATWVRWGAMLLAVVVLAAILIITPTTNGIVGAGRLLTLWPAALANIVFFLLWSWRIGHF